MEKALAAAIETRLSTFRQPENGPQTSTMSSPKFVKRQARKRRGRKRRMDSNPAWEHNVRFSEGSDTSLDEAQKDYMENVAAHQSDSASEDTVMMRRLSSLNVTSSSNLYGESDSVTESHVLPKQTLRRKKRFKRMVVDPTRIPPGGCPPAKIKFSCGADFLPECSRKRHKLKRSRNNPSDNAENASHIDGGKFGFDILGFKSKKRGCAGGSKNRSVSKPSKSDSSPQSPSQVDLATNSDSSVHQRVSTESPVSLPDTSSGTGRKLSGSDAASEKTIGREMECTSNESDVTMDALPSKDRSSCDSDDSLTSSDEGALYTNDEGREGDDEQSDFFQEPDALSGIPGIIPWWEKKTALRMKEDERFSNILNGTIPLLSRSAQRNYQSRLRSLQNGEDGQLRGCRPRIHKTKRLKRTSLSSVNEKIVGFLRNPHEKELLFQPMKKKERTQLGQLASLYSLDMRTEGARCKRSPVLVKTRNSTMGDPNLEEALGLVSLSVDRISPGRKSLCPQFVDAKRRRKTPPPTITEGQVGRSAGPIPQSNLGCQMLQSMGWVPGTGLGADGGGIQEPIKAYVRPKNRGLGYWKLR
ncbi:G patch domain-containing protein 2-like [Acanthaster planci]|uniref:G patch domain-containing protein 2-like n=1 Tax=Acanthaster planci TaxID=133434 RepID=A0A8B7Z1F2_ACAPL|nr:G patch domain-containing protein 2-like [Acanthaster planci]XP_022099429.1 G patch domain-containing protein 2-like [Acanthaster planci]XP_022099430.1 G patch domain-containing protein 2-like [Acanthaster planci]